MGSASHNTGVIIATAVAGSLFFTACVIFLLYWLYVHRSSAEHIGSTMAVYSGDNPTVIDVKRHRRSKSALASSTKGPQATAGKPFDGSKTPPQIRDTFQQPSAAFAQSLMHGVEHGQLSGEGFLAVQQQPGVYVASSSGDANIQQMLRELHPQVVAIAVLRHADTEQPAAGNLLLQDGSKLQVLPSLQQIHMAKAKSHNAFLRQENAVIIWNMELSLLPALVAMVQACLAVGHMPGAAAAVATVPAKAVGMSTADTKKDTALGVSRGSAKHGHKQRVLVIAASLLVAALACFITLGVTVAQSGTSAGGCSKPLNMTGVLWSDEFEDRCGTVTGVDPQNWNFQIGNGSAYGLTGWGNNELEFYTDAVSNAQVTTHDGVGVLQITARKESANGVQPYTSAKLVTQGLQSFTPKNSPKGIRFAVRALMPEGGPGIWPAVWMMPVDNAYGPWPASGELDVFELTSTLKIQSTVWYGPSYPSTIHQYGQSNVAPGVFHVYAMDWTLQGLSFSIDGSIYYSIQPETSTTPGYYTNPNTTNATIADGAPFDQPFYVLMNLAVGGTFSGDPTADTTFPQSLFIDYVRVYELA
ncbi:hypothetical protein ABBQ38_014965 [Trebouxia sp. C0009 RCD-2024]